MSESLPGSHIGQGPQNSQSRAGWGMVKVPRVGRNPCQLAQCHTPHVTQGRGGTLPGLSNEKQTF